MGTFAVMVGENQVRLDIPEWDNERQISSTSSMTTETSAFALQHTLLIPAHVSALTYMQNGMLVLGSGEPSCSSTACIAQP